MDSPLTVIMLAAGLVIAILPLLLVGHFHRDWKRHTLRRPKPTVVPPRAAVIIPVKGAPPGLPAILDAFSNLDYPNYELLLAVEAEDDPAYGEGNRLSGLNPTRVRVVVAGRTTCGSQKITNQLAAWRALDPGVEIFCFADADAVPPRDWLACLVDWSTVAPNKALVSGYRWFFPRDQRKLATLFACSINNAVALAPRDRRWNLPWGGAMAAHRDLLRRVDLSGAWRGVASDDLALGEAVRRHGGYVEQIRDLLVPTPVSYRWGELVEFLRRQYTMVWLYARKHWVCAALITTSISLAWIAALCLAFRGYDHIWEIFVGVYSVGIVKAYKRWRFAVEKWTDECHRTSLRWLFWTEALASPVITIFHAVCILSTIGRQHFSWAGVSYDAQNPHGVISTHPQQKSPGTSQP